MAWGGDPMKKNWNKRGLLLGGLMFSLTLTGCGDKKEDYITQTEDSTTISFSWWGNDNRHVYTLDALDIFEKKNPDLNVKPYYSVWNGYEKRIRTYMESHTEADIMQINYAWLDVFSSDGEGFYDLNQIKDIAHLETYSDEELSYGIVNGKLNAVPVSFNTYSVYHNKDLYEKYGLEVPVTWDDYFRAAEKMREDGIYALGVIKKPAFFLMISHFEQTTGRNVFADDGTFLLTEEDMVSMLELYKQMLDEKVLMPPADFERASFIEEQVASTIAWVTDAPGYCDDLIAKDREIVIGEYPATENPILSGLYIKPACMYAVSKNTEHPKETGRLLRFLINSSDMLLLQKLEKGVPAGETAFGVVKKANLLDGLLYDAHQKMDERRAEMRLIVPAMEIEAVIEAFKTGADEYIFGKMELEDCAKMICKDIRALTEE